MLRMIWVITLVISLMQIHFPCSTRNQREKKSCDRNPENKKKDKEKLTIETLRQFKVDSCLIYHFET